MSTMLKVPEKSARKLLQAMNIPGAAKATPKRLVKLLEDARGQVNGDSIEDLDIPSSSKSLMEEVVEAIDEEKTIKIVGAAVEEDDEEEVTPKKKASKSTKTSKGKQPKTKKKSEVTAKTKTKKKSPGGKTAKDQVFEAWLKQPKLTPKEMAEKLGPKLDVKETTISKWVSNMKRGAGIYPRISKGREKEIKIARKLGRSAD